MWILAFAARLLFMLFVAYSKSPLALRSWPYTNVQKLDPANFLRLCAWALTALLGGMAIFVRQHGFTMDIVLGLGWLTIASALLIPLCYLPLNFPTWLDPRWYDNVRKGLVDELGNLLPRGGALRATTELTLSGGQKREFSTRLTLPLGWQQVEEAPSYLTPRSPCPQCLNRSRSHGLSPSMSTDAVNLRNSCQQRTTSTFRDFERGYCTAGSGVVHARRDHSKQAESVAHVHGYIHR